MKAFVFSSFSFSFTISDLNDDHSNLTFDDRILILSTICWTQKIAPEYPSIPLNDYCDKNWLFVQSTQKCIYHDIKERSWAAALDNCKSKDGDFASINSPTEQNEILTILGTFFYDMTSIGKNFSLNFESKTAHFLLHEVSKKILDLSNLAINDKFSQKIDIYCFGLHDFAGFAFSPVKAECVVVSQTMVVDGFLYERTGLQFLTRSILFKSFAT